MFKTLLVGATSAALMLSAATATAGHHENGGMHNSKAAIEKAVNDNAFRTERDMERDQFRNPAETLAFFGITDSMTVAEAGPSSGWYTRILAPLTAENGKYIALNSTPSAGERFEGGMQWRESFINHESGLFGANASARFMGQNVPFAAPNSVDAVLIFRGMHGPIVRGATKDMLAEVLATLKPGGVLGVVQHREPEGFENDPTKNIRGYVKQSFVIDLITKAGFELVATSEINANAKDPANWERGVWTLQAGKPVAEKDEQFQKIGESDRMTLKFIKPVKAD